MPDVRLRACAPRPLLGYLKALGVLRTVSTQADGHCRARWHAGALELRSELSEGGLTDFLLNDYAPSPVVSPWNGGSGFHPNDNKDAITALERSDDARFAHYQETIAATRATLAAEGIADKPTKDEKLRLIRALRRRLPDAALAWVDAAVVVTGDEPAYPPLLGSGGNDGRYDFSNNYAQAAVACLLGEPDTARPGLEAALTGTAAELQRKLSLGHLSRDASPTNSPQGEADSLGNPWDLVLALEGTLLLAAGAARRLDTAHRSALVAPFTVYSTGAGYGSALTGEAGRAELWLPLWSKWASLSEIVTLVRESRAQVRTGRSRRAARTGLDFARASGELGVARGIDAFERYAILERAGQSSLAVPAGRISVAARPAAAALSSIDQWLNGLQRLARGDGCPRAIRQAVHTLDQAAFRAASRGSEADVGALVEAMGATEQTLAISARSAVAAGVRPLRRAPATPWLGAADDRSPEFAVAASLASLRDRDGKQEQDRPAVRDYLHGTRAQGSEFDSDRRHAVHGSSPMHLLAALHAHRHLDAARHEAATSGSRPGPRLSFTSGAPCPLTAIRLFAADRLDEGRVLRLLRGFSLLDHTSYHRTRFSSEAPADESCPQPALETLLLAWTPRRSAGEEADAASSSGERTEAPGAIRLGPRPGWAALLAAGRTARVLNAALLRLRQAQLPLVFNSADLVAGAPPGERLSAALLVPVPRAQRAALEDRLTIKTLRENEEAA